MAQKAAPLYMDPSGKGQRSVLVSRGGGGTDEWITDRSRITVCSRNLFGGTALSEEQSRRHA